MRITILLKLETKLEETEADLETTNLSLYALYKEDEELKIVIEAHEETEINLNIELRAAAQNMADNHSSLETTHLMKIDRLNQSWYNPSFTKLTLGSPKSLRLFYQSKPSTRQLLQLNLRYHLISRH